MPKFDVWIDNTRVYGTSITVEAKDDDAARELACLIASDDLPFDDPRYQDVDWQYIENCGLEVVEVEPLTAEVK